MTTIFAAQATVVARIQGKFVRSDELGSAADQFELNQSLSFASGVGDLGVDLIYRETLVADGTPIVIGGASAFVDAFGVSRGFQSVKFIQIVNRETLSINAIEVTSVDDFTGLGTGIVIPGNGGVYLACCPGDGWEAAGDGDATFTLTSLEDPASVDIVIGGVSY